MQTAQPQFPDAHISNGLVTARLYVPDPRRGFYRSTRFDWSGVVTSLAYQGHEFYGPGPEGNWMLNAMYRLVPADHPEVYAGSDNPGADALKVEVSFGGQIKDVTEVLSKVPLSDVDSLEVKRMAPVVPEIMVSALGADAVVDGCIAAGTERGWQLVSASLPS